MAIKNKRLLVIVSVIILLLITPLIAMMFTNEVNWNLIDFVIAGFLLLGTGLSIEFMLRKIQKPKHRVFILMGILLSLLLIWAELAVGIFGTPLAGN